MSLTENELLRKLVEETSFPEIDESKDVTRKMLQKSAHISYDKATDVLEKLASEGKLKKYQARAKSGLVVWAYRMKDNGS